MRRPTSIAFRVAATALLAAMASTWPSQASAYTECKVNLSTIWAGDGGTIWLQYTNGGAVNIGPNDPNKQSALTMGIAALTFGHSITVRYSADGADCTQFGRTDFLGVYLNAY